MHSSLHDLMKGKLCFLTFKLLRKFISGVITGYYIITLNSNLYNLFRFGIFENKPRSGANVLPYMFCNTSMFLSSPLLFFDWNTRHFFMLPPRTVVDKLLSQRAKCEHYNLKKIWESNLHVYYNSNFLLHKYIKIKKRLKNK